MLGFGFPAVSRGPDQLPQPWHATASTKQEASKREARGTPIHHGQSRSASTRDE